jgi:cytochrome P450
MKLGFGPTHRKESLREPGFVSIFERAFSRERYNHFAKVTRAGHLSYMKAFWNKDIQQVDLFSEMYSLNIRLVIRAFIGEMPEGKLLQLIETVKSLDLEERIKSMSSILYNFSPAGRKELDRYWFSSVDLVKELVKSRLNHVNEDASVEFLDFLIKETTDEKGVIDYGLLTTRVFSLIFVAVLNTFATGAWFLFRVFDNPQIYAKVKAEQEEYYSYLKDPNVELGTILINKFPYSENCIREVVRTSIAGISFRRAKQDFILHENDITFLVRKDSYLVMPYSTITGDANIYRDPEVFRPERFETEAKGPCENVSFGAGRHPCTGTKFAMLNVKNIAFNLMAHYDVTVPGKAEDYMPKLQHMGVFRPTKPVMFTLKKRQEVE